MFPFVNARGFSCLEAKQRTTQSLARREKRAFLAIRIVFECRLRPERHLVVIEVQIALFVNLAHHVAIVCIEFNGALHDLSGGPYNEAAWTRCITHLS